jgi:DNA repair exonuclease SbcCD ATPase subunit
MSKTKITHIYHLADLHIRNLKRHTEYRLVFQKFLDKVKEDDIESSIIYIAGDIAHTKTEMSPELVREISWFLTECSKLREVVLIAGNHDCNLNNNSRLDAITPIIQNLNNERIHYLRDTNVYNIHNLTFVVYSILDKRENWPKGELVSGEHKICLFHGPVDKSQTDIGYSVSSTRFTTEMFNGFDMVMMGDIHKRQILQEYDPTNNRPFVVYAGSMLQQNHGELLEGHGYLLWDVENRTFKEFDIHNDYGYLTVDINKGEVPNWVYDEIDTKLPKYPRLRLRFNETDAAKTKECITEFNRLFKNSEITVSRLDTMNRMRSNFGLNKNIVGNTKDEIFQNQLIRDYLDRRYLLDEDTLDEVVELNKITSQKVDKSEEVENILWIPKRLEYSNMFSYGEGNSVKFDNARGIVGIFAPNASGKSSLFDILSFCIFDRTSRTNSAKNILNNQRDKFYCKFEFEVDGISYFIERIGKLNKQQTAVKVDVNFWREVDGIIEPLNGEQRRDTNKIIEKYLGKFEDFILTTLSLQGNNALFIDKSQSERKEVLSQLLGVDIFDKLYQIASDDNKETSTLIRKFKQDDFPTKLVEIESNLSIYDSKLEIIKDEVQTYRLELEELNKTATQIKSKMLDTGSFDYTIANLENDVRLYEKSIKDIEVSTVELTDRYSKLLELENVIVGLISEYDKTNIDELVNELTNKSDRLKDIKHSIDKLGIKKTSLHDKLEHLEAHKYNERCDVCMDNSKSIIQSKSDINTELEKLNTQIKNDNELKVQLENRIKELIPYKTKQHEYKDLDAKYNKVDKDIYNIKSQISQLETKKISTESNLEKTKLLVDEYYKNEEQITINQTLKSQLRTTDAKIKELILQIDNKNKDLMDTFKRHTTLESQKEIIGDRIIEVKELEERNKLYEYYLNALSKDGVSLELIEKAIPMLEGEINNILSQIVEFGMELELDGKNINANLVYGDQKWSLELCSGMERFISGLAIRIALINVSNLPRPNFLVIDEGFGTLDNENLTSLYMIFAYLKTQFDFVMIISHIDSMRDVVDTLMEIKKENGFSMVKF